MVNPRIIVFSSSNEGDQMMTSVCCATEALYVIITERPNAAFEDGLGMHFKGAPNLKHLEFRSSRDDTRQEWIREAVRRFAALPLSLHTKLECLVADDTDDIEEKGDPPLELGTKPDGTPLKLTFAPYGTGVISMYVYKKCDTTHTHVEHVVDDEHDVEHVDEHVDE